MQTLKPLMPIHTQFASLKRAAIVLTAIITSCNCFSQDVISKNSLSFSAGASIPVGNFRGATPLDKVAGYAKPGETVNISFEHIGKKHLAFTIMLYGQRNPVNTGAFANQFPQTLFFYNQASGEWRSYGNWTVDKKSWYIGSLLAGAAREWPIDKKGHISLIEKMVLGICYVQSPALHAESRSDTAYVVLNQTSASSFGFSFQATAGIKYRLANKVYFLLNAGYFGTNTIKFKNVTETVFATNGGLNIPGIYSLSNSRGPIIGSSGTYTTSQPIGTVNITAGIAWAL